MAFIVWYLTLKLQVLCNYRPKRSFGQGNIFTPVCHSFCSQGGRGVPDQAPTPGTRQVHSPWDQAGTPPRDQAGTPPGARQVHPPRTRQVHPRADTPPGTRQVPPTRDQAGTPPQTRQVHPPGSRHPPWDQAGRHPPPPRTRQVHPPPGYGQRSAGTHPTGMHSCCWSFYKTIPFFCRTDEEDMDPLVTPHTLSAAMKVDSAFVSNLLPGIQCNLSASLLQLRLVNHLSCLGKGMNLM